MYGRIRIAIRWNADKWLLIFSVCDWYLFNFQLPNVWWFHYFIRFSFIKLISIHQTCLSFSYYANISFCWALIHKFVCGSSISTKYLWRLNNVFRMGQIVTDQTSNVMEKFYWNLWPHYIESNHAVKCKNSKINKQINEDDCGCGWKLLMIHAHRTQFPHKLKPYFVDCLFVCCYATLYISHISDWLYQWLFAIRTRLFAENELKWMHASQESCKLFNLQIDSNSHI